MEVNYILNCYISRQLASLGTIQPYRAASCVCVEKQFYICREIEMAYMQHKDFCLLFSAYASILHLSNKDLAALSVTHINQYMHTSCESAECQPTSNQEQMILLLFSAPTLLHNVALGFVSEGNAALYFHCSPYSAFCEQKGSTQLSSWTTGSAFSRKCVQH